MSGNQLNPYKVFICSQCYKFYVTTKVREFYCVSNRVSKNGIKFQKIDTYDATKYCSRRCANPSCRTREKVRKTCLDKYGVDNYSKTEECWLKIHETCQNKYNNNTYLGSSNHLSKMKQTCLSKYDVEYYFHTEDYKDKSRKTCLEKYGSYHQWCSNSNIRDKSFLSYYNNTGYYHPSQNPEVKLKQKLSTLLNNDGLTGIQIGCKKFCESNNISNPMELKYIRDKIYQTRKKNLSSILGLSISEVTKDIVSKNSGYALGHKNGTILKTKKENLVNLIKIDINNIVNNLFEIQRKLENKEVRLPVGHSLDEFYFYKYLVEDLKFNWNDIEWCYTDDRYPFECDFYIKSLDLFIELNFFWTHGGHKLDLSSCNDINKLNFWKKKSETSEFYKVAIGTWKNDLRKFEYVEKNNLNYIAFYNWREIYDYFNVYY